MTELPLLTYQLSVLKSEFDHLTKRPDSRRSGIVRSFLTLHARQFAWTMQRALGLSGDRRQRVVFKSGERAGAAGCRLLIDVSNTFSSPLQTGIQRVVKEFADACSAAGFGVPVLIRRSGLLRADDSALKGQRVDIRPGDVLFLLDSNWRNLDDCCVAIREIQSRGGHVVACLYDMIPIQFPSTCNRETMESFTAWLDMMLYECDAFLCISKTTARALSRHAAAQLDGTKPPPIGWFRLGANLPAIPASASQDQIWSRRPYLLMVGTLEPRKGHPIALEAIEALWRKGVDINLVIIGRRGWSMRFFERQLERHPERNRRMFWLSDAGDDDLIQAYRNAEALIYPSIAEGYGLPIIEAAALGTPVIVSDLDIFREIAPPDAIFFRACDATDLAEKIAGTLEERPRVATTSGQRPRVAQTQWIAPSWSDSAASAYTIISERGYQLQPD